MDFVPIFGQVQGVLLKANNSYALSNLRTRGGNEEKIQSVVDALAKVLTERRLLYKGCAVEEYSDILRKINFFLILNSDLVVLEELANSDDIGHLIWITPMITKCLLMHLVWGLDLHEFFCEALKFCNPALSLEILEIATEYARYSTPDESIKRVALLVSSTYEMVIRTSQRSVQVKDQKVILVKAHDKMCQLLKYFNDPPNKSKMSDWTVDRLYLHAGRSILLLFEHLIYCFSMFSSKPPQVPAECDIYQATYDEIDESFSEKKDNMDDIVAEYIDKINQLLLESAKNNVMAINVDIYCSWCEHLDVKNSNISLQRSVGETAYQLCEVLKSDPRLENEVISMLPAISCRPENISDHISQACRETMMERSTEKHANQGIWLAGLIRKNYFFFEEDCLKCAINNVSCLLPTDITATFKQGVKILYEPVKYEYANFIKLLVLKCLSSHTTGDQVALIKETFADYTLGDRLELSDYEIKQTEFFNKLLEPFADSDLIEMYSLFIQNPTKFYRRTFKECVVKPQQTTMMLTALTELKVFSQLRIEYEFDPTPYTAQNANLSGSALLILHAVKNMHVENLTSEVEKLSYVFFIKGLVGKELASDEIILLKVLMPSIHKHLTEKNCECLQVHLRALQEIFSTEQHVRFIAPLLVMLAQIMEYVRWDLSTFTATAAEVLKSSIVFQSAILKTFLQSKQPSDNEFKWLASKLTFLTPMNAHYFQELWPQQYFKELYDTSLGAKDSMICLCYLLPRSLVSEWKTIFSGMCLKNDVTACFISLCSVVKFITRSAEELGTPNAFACVEHCCRNAAKILQEIIVAKETNAEKLVLIKSVISVVNGVPSRMQYVCFSSFLTPLTPLVTSYVDLCQREDSEVKKLMGVIEELSQEECRSVMRMVVVQGAKP